jgi:hypothetical protein
MQSQPLQISKSFVVRIAVIVLGAVLILAALPGRMTAQQNATSSPVSSSASSNASGATAGSVPQIIQFNGQFNGTEGGGGSTAVPAGTVSVTFTLYENEQGGTALWSETQNVQVDAQGHYTALLGSASPEGLPMNLFTTAQAHWLAVQPAGPDYAERPRVLLVSAPYALKAGDAETIGGLPPSAFVRADTSLGGSGTTAAAAGTTVGTVATSVAANGAATQTNQQPPTVPANYNVTTGYQINGSYVVATPGSASVPNTALGSLALAHITTGNANVATGFAALFNTTTGYSNTATGWGAMNFNTGGIGNTAVGTKALYHNTTAGSNVAIGAVALLSNTTGSYNTATGTSALFNNTTGSYNTAEGYEALYSNTTGSYSAAVGPYTLYSDTTGIGNTGFGYGSLYLTTSGNDNAGLGGDSLLDNTTGGYNTAVGTHALISNTTGSNNIGVGYQAGINVAGGNSNNIEIEDAGSSSDNGTIRIGTSGTQTSSYIAGIYGVTLPSAGQPLVCVDSAGQLGTANCASNGQAAALQEAINQKQQQQIQAQAQQIADLQQRLARLEALVGKK